MAENPIKYSDFISPDSSITDAIKQLEALDSAYEQMKVNVVNSAKEVSASMKKVTSATEEGQETTRKGVTEADKLEQAYKKLDESQSINAKTMAALKLEQAAINNEVKNTAKLNDAAVGSYNALSAQYSLNVQKLNAMSKAERDSTKEGKALVNETKNLRKEMVAAKEATGDQTLKVGDYMNKLGELPGPLGGVVSGMWNMVKAAWAFIATPIGAIIAAVVVVAATLYSLFSKFEPLLDKIEQGVAGVVAIFSVLKDALVGLITGQKSLSETFNGLGDSMSKAATEAVKLAKAQQDIEDAQDRLIESQAKSKRQIDELLLQSKDRTKSEKERANLIDQALKIEEEAYGKKKEIADGEYEIALGKMAVSNRLTEEQIADIRTRGVAAIQELQNTKAISREDLQDFAAKSAAREDILDESVMIREKAINRQNALLDKADADRAKAEEDKRKAEEDAKKKAEQNAKDEEAKRKKAIEDAYNAQASIIEVERKTIELKLDVVAKGSEEELALKKQLIENSRKQELLENQKNSVDPSLINARIEMQKRAAEDEFNQLSLVKFDQQQSLAASEFALLKSTEDEKTKFKLQQEKARLEQILKLNESANAKMSDTEVEIAKNTIARLSEEIASVGQGQKNIYEMMGITLTEADKQNAAASLQYGMDLVKTLVDSKVALADIAVQASQKEVDANQKKLDQEIEARNAGFASNVTLAQRNLDLAKKNANQALKEKERAQKAQARLDTIAQASSLVTAVAGIWSSFASMGPWGVALAIAATGLLFGSFAASKLKANQVTKAQNASESYGDGTVELLEGGSHASGNDIDLGRKSDGTRRRAEGGEYFAVINKRNSRKYRSVIPDVINSLNRGIFGAKYMSAYDSASLSINVNNSPDLSGLSSDVRAIREQNKRKYFTNGKGETVEIYKNTKRTYLNN